MRRRRAARRKSRGGDRERPSQIRCIAAVRPLSRARLALLRMTEGFNGIKKIRHPDEEAAKRPSRRTHRAWSHHKHLPRAPHSAFSRSIRIALAARNAIMTDKK